MKMLSNELFKLMRLKALEIIPILASILTEAWGVILSYHIYQADALQVTTCRYSKSDALLSGDRALVETSRKLGLKAFDIVKEEDELTTFIET